MGGGGGVNTQEKVTVRLIYRTSKSPHDDVRISDAQISNRQCRKYKLKLNHHKNIQQRNHYPIMSAIVFFNIKLATDNFLSTQHQRQYATMSDISKFELAPQNVWNMRHPCLHQLGNFWQCLTYPTWTIGQHPAISELFDINYTSAFDNIGNIRQKLYVITRQCLKYPI